MDDPDDPSATAQACFTAAIVYACFLAFCGCQVRGSLQVSAFLCQLIHGNSLSCTSTIHATRFNCNLYRDDIYDIKDIPLLVPCFSPPSKSTTCWNDVTIEGLEWCTYALATHTLYSIAIYNPYWNRVLVIHVMKDDKMILFGNCVQDRAISIVKRCCIVYFT